MASSLDTEKKSKHLIIVSLPDDAYYRKSFEDIECFIRDMSEKTTSIDDFMVVYSTALEKRYRKLSTSPLGSNTKHLIVEKSLDLWMRDFSPVLPKLQLKFRYKPKYLKTKVAKLVESDFMKALETMDVQLEHSELVLDGGNVVNNGNKVIISERVLHENRDPEDTTGHADGIVAFLEEDIVLIGDYGDEEYYKAVEVAVKSTFPEVETFRLPCRKQDGSSGDQKWDGFTTAVGSYVNMLVTNKAVYVPQFNQPYYDLQASEVIKSHTSKKIIPVDMSKLSHMGGSVRCMSWQIESSHPVAQALCKNCKM